MIELCSFRVTVSVRCRYIPRLLFSENNRHHDAARQSKEDDELASQSFTWIDVISNLVIDI